MLKKRTFLLSSAPKGVNWPVFDPFCSQTAPYRVYFDVTITSMT